MWATFGLIDAINPRILTLSMRRKRPNLEIVNQGGQNSLPRAYVRFWEAKPTATGKHKCPVRAVRVHRHEREFTPVEILN